MLLLYLLILWKVEAVPEYSLNMYNTGNYQDGYCLRSYSFREDNYPHPTYKQIHQITSYCLRISEEDNFMADFTFQNTVDPRFTFVDLKEKNITSHMLLSWSAPIDVTEKYELFLINNSDSLSDKKVIFYNCTSPWFGPSCRFTFISDLPFSYIVDIAFQSKYSVITDTKATCYTHLHCQTILSCLDWREICDGKSDCLDSSDENHCWQLEVNDCNDNEFRCHNGQCIPIEFFGDVHLFPDCLDRTDEFLTGFSFLECYQDPTFSCEEHTCGPSLLEFPCGDGQCSTGLQLCMNGRVHLLPSSLCANSIDCFKNFNFPINFDWCDTYCLENSCITDNCANLYKSLSMPILFGHVRFMYSNKESNFTDFTLPDYVCYDEQLCGDFLPATEHFDNLTCRSIDDLALEDMSTFDSLESLVISIKNLFRPCLVVTNEAFYCNYSTMYQCENSSKCISKQRLLDGLQDCPYNDDETYNQSCLLGDIRQRFKCSVNDIEKCFASLILQDGVSHCQYFEDESIETELLIKTHIYFQMICDGKTELSPVLISGRNETDETDCEHWECNNTYSRCDDFWLCKDGADEVNCQPSTCPEHHHDCVFPNDTSKVSCLQIAQAGNNIDDCLGGIDERRKYPVLSSDWYYIMYTFHCWNDTKSIIHDQLCNNQKDCPFNDDEIFCTNLASPSKQICDYPEQTLTGIKEFYCGFDMPIYRPDVINFKLTNIPTYPLTLGITNVPSTASIQPIPSSIDKNWIDDFGTNDDAWFCNRGIPIYVRMDTNTSKLYCLCPPSYYGYTCQYQNQRVSLTVQFQISSDWRKTYIFIITLIDNKRNIESHDYVEYLPVRDCIAKYNIYLLYSTRPKNMSKNYSVQIDAFNQFTLDYRASWIFPLQFSFLPVHRLPILLKVPISNTQPTNKCSPPCAYGQCFSYVNNQTAMFCRCHSGWSGVQCNIEYTCNCAVGSVCLSNSICLCPQGRYGPQCHFHQLACRVKSCLNGGYCIPKDERYRSDRSDKSICICPEGYTGEHCEHRQKETRIDISFHHKLTIPSSLLIHFIAVHRNKQPNSTSLMRKIAFDQYSSTFYIFAWFNIAFAEIDNDYYLIILHEQPIVSKYITTQVIPSHRCRSIAELFNQTFAKEHLLKRIKYYHLPCKQRSDLTCFYDDVHLCLCTLYRTANCLEFNHNTTYDCGGYNVCENDGLCFQQNPTCPTSFCGCHPCYFGSRCQFTTKGSTLSLDIILAYHIRSKTGIHQQSNIVKVAVALTTILGCFSLINIFLSLTTFREKETRTVGCGLYLLTTSTISMIIMIVFIVKFWLFLLSKTGSINNRSFLYIQCTLMDYLLRCLLSTSDWLSACVAIERTVTISKGVTFDKRKSKQIAKWMISVVIVFISCTYIYDPFYRRLIDDDNEERTWCVSQYSSSIQVFDWLLNIFHYSLPFAINCISAVIIIIIATRTRSNSQKQKPFKQHLREQLQRYKHLLISPLILIVLSLPRLVISLLSGCMKSARESWFYLIGYFISFIPSIMTFVVFVLPSEMYKKDFIKSIQRICQR